MLKQYFKNHRHNVFIKKNIKELVKNALATGNDTKPHASMVKATEVFLSLRKPGAGKILFEMENKEAIHTAMND